MSGAVAEGISGALGASIALLTTYPLITISTRQATQIRDASSASESRSPSTEKLSLQSYYHGIYPSLVGTVTSSGLYFFFYATLRKAVQKSSLQTGPQQSLSVGESLVVASVAGSLNVLATTPIWSTVTRMQTSVSNHQRASFFQEVSSIYREGGVASLWKGTIPALIMVVNPTIQYALYEWGSGWWRQRRKAASSTSLNAGEIFLISALAKLGATLATYPVQVVKNRVQAARGNECSRRDGLLNVIRQVWSQEGIWGFFAGMRVKIVQSVLAAALMFVLKERLYNVSSKVVTKAQHLAR